MFPAEAPPVAAAAADAFDPVAWEDASDSDATTAVPAAPAAPADVEDVANPPDADSPMCLVAAASPRRAEAMKLFEKYIVAVVVCDVND